MIFGVRQIVQAGIDATPIVSIIVGVSLGAAFMRRQRTLSDPLIDLGLFRAPAFSTLLATYAA
jgi:MFS transporter, DHA2 family, multidrug resistance protein